MIFGSFLRRLRRRTGNGNRNVIYDRPLNHRDLCRLQTIKKFVERGYSPSNYNPGEEVLYLVNNRGETLTMAEIPPRIATFLNEIQE